MRLHKWLYEQNISVVDFAKQLHISRNHMSGIVNESRKAGIRLARDIELITDGLVSEEDLRNVDVRRVK